MYIIDIGRHDLTQQQFIEHFKKIDAFLKQKDGTMAYSQIKLDNGIDYAKEYTEIALALITKIVYHK